MASSTRDLEFYDLSHPWGQGVLLWPYFPDIKIKRFHCRFPVALGQG